jgi:hypothetical protein
MACRDAPEHDADHGEADESSGFASMTLEVLGETTAVANPGEGSFDDPAFGQDNKAMEIAALDDLQPCTSFGNRLSGTVRRPTAPKFDFYLCARPSGDPG